MSLPYRAEFGILLLKFEAFLNIALADIMVAYVMQHDHRISFLHYLCPQELTYQCPKMKTWWISGFPETCTFAHSLDLLKSLCVFTV